MDSKLLARHGVIVVVPLISPYRETREFTQQELAASSKSM